MSVAFITAIGTDCGKTHAGAAIVRHLAGRRRNVLALKPLMSGFDPDKLEGSDAGRLLGAMGRAVTEEEVDAICWRRFTEWSAPNVAARNAGVDLDYAEMLEAFLRPRIGGFAGDVLVEGAGGVMSPLTDDRTNIDLAADLNAPVLLMASNYLGAVSHTLTALECLARRNLRVVAVAVTQTLPNAGLAAPLVQELTLWTDIPVVACGFSRAPADDETWAAGLAERLFG